MSSSSAVETEAATRELTLGQAAREALAEELRRDPTVFVIGEDVAEAGTAFKVFTGLVEEFGPLAGSSDHRLSVGTSGEPVLAEADELRALQLGRILVENAMLHTPAGTPVEIRALERGEHAVLEVEDAGDGIGEEQREQLFQRFFRLDGTRASGSGLGLAIAKQLAELMDGAIELDSRPGRTVFALVLPRSQSPVEPFSREKALSAGA